MNKKLLIAFILSSILSLLVSFLSNLATTYLAPALANQAVWVYGALIVTFLISLPVSYYLLSQASAVPLSDAPHITQTAKKKGRIEDSPIDVAANSNARVDVNAEDEGKIKGSGVTIR